MRNGRSSSTLRRRAHESGTRFCGCAVFAGLALSLAFAASAQDYPNRPIRLIVASSPGSGVDIATRWFGILAPARTPPKAIATLNAALNKVMRERDMQDKIAGEGAEPAPSRPEEFGKPIASELAVWGKVIKAAGLQ